jgi:hypothetical protein
LLSFVCRQLDVESSPFPGFAFHADTSLEALYDLLADRETQPRSASLFGRLERVKELLEIFLLNTGAGIAYHEYDISVLPKGS